MAPALWPSDGAWPRCIDGLQARAGSFSGQPPGLEAGQTGSAAGFGGRAGMGVDTWSRHRGGAQKSSSWQSPVSC